MPLQMSNRKEIERYNRKVSLKQLLEELKEIKEDLGGGMNDKYIERDQELQQRIDDFVKKKLKYYSLLTMGEITDQEAKKPSDSLIKGKFDSRGIYQPAMFEHLTNEKYFEFQEMETTD